MLYTVTLTVQDLAAPGRSYQEQVYLTEAGEDDSEETVAARVSVRLDTGRFDTGRFAQVGPADVRPLLSGDFSEALFAKHFSDLAAYREVWEGEGSVPIESPNVGDEIRLEGVGKATGSGKWSHIRRGSGYGGIGRNPYKTFVGLLVFGSFSEEGQPLYCEELHLLQAADQAAAEAEYERRIAAGEFRYTGGAGQTITVRLVQVRPLEELTDFDPKFTQLLSRSFSDPDAYGRATTVAS
ncbi:hypothetical protein ACFP81_12440 [Deinococcus lacus]|uniref:Uncharacterized protein n=1 Tax=Deinococcus lacus TaxID=392561 RepID=A0ABW1YEF7_9DEIO